MGNDCCKRLSAKGKWPFGHQLLPTAIFRSTPRRHSNSHLLHIPIHRWVDLGNSNLCLLDFGQLPNQLICNPTGNMLDQFRADGHLSFYNIVHNNVVYRFGKIIGALRLAEICFNVYVNNIIRPNHGFFLQATVISV